MRIDCEDLVRTFQGNGSPFEEFVHDLVVTIGRSCGIDPTDIDWDYRTNVQDGGRDLLVKVPNQRADKKFLPDRRSIWSIKSGDAGISPASLKKEIKNHPKVKAALQKGWSFIWCTIHPATVDQREAMREAADEVADELNVDRSLIGFRWPDQFHAEVNLYPNLIPVHLPHIGSVLADVLSLEQWGRELELADEWVRFGSRDDVVQRVSEHLLGRQSPNVLHVAGLSGIGKTRTVYEACRRAPELKGVFYFGQYGQVGFNLYRYLEEEGRHVCLVIDETPLDRVETVMGRLGDFADRIRVVTIGPAVRQPAITRDNILVLPEPDRDAGVFEVVRAAGSLLSEEVQRSIAEQSSHDLRLALLLVRASLRLPDFRGVPVVNIDGVWQRLMGLFAHEIGDPHEFRKFYEVLTSSIDVGMFDDVGGEIAALAAHFKHPLEHVRDAAVTSVRCGLGLRTRRFFEATPRALAARLFTERVWPRIQDVLEDFFLCLPERLARRFLERCHDCSGPVREEVMARLGDFFLRALSGEDVTVLASRPASRLFQSWAELDPGRGLNWLRQKVERAAPEQLLALEGGSDGSGGWRGRRQLVWLCQNLASFSEYFEPCEAILFRLALHETEPSIGNNSTAVWESLFWPALASTELSFDRRLPILLHRLQGATPEELPLVVSAAVGCIEHRVMGLPVPPRVVGGRIVPQPWRPRTWNEIGSYRRQAGSQVLETIAGLPEDRLPRALSLVAEHLGAFTDVGLLDRVRSLFRLDQLGDPLRRLVVAQVEKQIGFLREIGRENRPNFKFHQLEEWLAELSPPDLAARVRDLTAQKYWSFGLHDDREARYERLAEELVMSPETFRGLADWFDAPEVRSADSLGFYAGRRDKDARLADIIRDWLQTDRCRSVTLGYLNGTMVREGKLSEEWAAILDALSINRPELVSLATASADVSERGFDRLLRLLDSVPPPSSRFLQPLAFGSWLRAIGPRHRARAAEALVRLAGAGDPEAAEIGIDVILMWAHVDSKAIDSTLAALALDLVSQPFEPGSRRDFYKWREILLLLCPSYPRQVAALMVSRITEPRGWVGWGDPENVEVLARAATVSPSDVMEVVGEALLDRNRRTIFGVTVFHGLFEAIGLKYIVPWLERHSRGYLRWMARHFPSPYLDPTGRPVVPALTDWLFREHEGDNEAFEWFLMGCHSGGLWTRGEVNPDQKRQDMQPFLEHELRRVREWAEYQIRHEERNADFFRDLEDEGERR
jgi:hypothetical protein